MMDVSACHRKQAEDTTFQLLYFSFCDCVCVLPVLMCHKSTVTFWSFQGLKQQCDISSISIEQVVSSNKLHFRDSVIHTFGEI